MSHHPDRDFADYILNGIKNGFRLGINPEATYTSVSRNMQSASLHQDMIDKYLEQETELGNILGPFPRTTAPVIHVNRFGVIPKKTSNGKMAADNQPVFPRGVQY